MVRNLAPRPRHRDDPDDRAADTESPFEWPLHFVAGDLNGRKLGARSGTIALDAYDQYLGDHWGEARGTVSMLVAIEPTSGGVEQSIVELTFHVPVGFRIEWLHGPPPGVAATRAQP